MVIDSIIENRKHNKNLINLKDLKEVILYGVGNLGKKLDKELSEWGVNVAGLIDRNAEHIHYDKKVCGLQEADKNLNHNIPVILSGLFDCNSEKDIRADLNKIGFGIVYALHELDWENIFDTEFGRSVFISSYNINDLSKDRDDIVFAYNLLSEDIDKKCFLNHLSAYRNMDFSVLSKPGSLACQYSDDDLKQQIDYSNFIDCGAYDGDSLRNLLSAGKNIRRCLAFEPQLDLCNKMMETEWKDVCVAVIPCGVSSNIEQKCFAVSAEGKSSGKVSDRGDVVVQCETIDMIADVFKPTFIKMDIEGSELEALHGAEKTIQKYKPSLAICVYHDLSHLWKAALFIHKINNSYNFYLRNYNILGFETVLYAIPK